MMSQIISSLIRSYTSQSAYEQDVMRLARLGYVAISVVEEPTLAPWIERIHRLFGSMRPRLTVTYRDAGVTPHSAGMEGPDVAIPHRPGYSDRAINGAHSRGRG
jgi:hypothetical protein